MENDVDAQANQKLIALGKNLVGKLKQGMGGFKPLSLPLPNDWVAIAQLGELFEISDIASVKSRVEFKYYTALVESLNKRQVQQNPQGFMTIDLPEIHSKVNFYIDEKGEVNFCVRASEEGFVFAGYRYVKGLEKHLSTYQSAENDVKGLQRLKLEEERKEQLKLELAKQKQLAAEREAARLALVKEAEQKEQAKPADIPAPNPVTEAKQLLVAKPLDSQSSVWGKVETNLPPVKVYPQPFSVKVRKNNEVTPTGFRTFESVRKACNTTDETLKLAITKVNIAMKRELSYACLIRKEEGTNVVKCHAVKRPTANPYLSNVLADILEKQISQILATQAIDIHFSLGQMRQWVEFSQSCLKDKKQAESPAL